MKNELFIKITYILLLIILSVFSISCATEIPDTGEKIEITVPKEESKELSSEELYQELFSLENKVLIYIDIEETELENIENDYQYYNSIGSKSPIYRKCDVTITLKNYSYKINEVGIRMKGNTSRTSFYDHGIKELIHFKLSFSETFDDKEYYKTPKIWNKEEREIRKNRTFATLEKMDLKWNKCEDHTHVREIYAYDFYKQNGLLSPKANVCELKIKNLNVCESLGTYTLIEPIDKHFIHKRFPNEEVGDLYKVGWGKIEDNSSKYQGGTLTNETINSIGIENEDECYFPIYDLKTNKKSSKHNELLNLINSLSQSDNDLYSIIDIDYFLKFMAISYLLGNPDDYRAHYNNYYIYFHDDNGVRKALFIPYDYDRCLGITKDWNPGKAMTKYGPCELYTTDLGVNENPLIEYILSSKELKNAYLNHIKKIMDDSFFSFETFSLYYNKALMNYKDIFPLKTINKLLVPFAITESNDLEQSETNLSIKKYFELIQNTINKG